jgi:hypothetical protein
MGEVNVDPLAELDAMKSIAEALGSLEEAAVRRVLRWANDKFGSRAAAAPHVDVPAQEQSAATSTGENGVPKFDDLADFYAATNPGSDAEKALAVGYWLQVVNGVGEFDSQSINKELKNLGYAVGNITNAFSNLAARKPALAIQTRKSGNSQQARKRYKLTVEGLKAVARMTNKESA